MRESRNDDVLIIGGGHNGLVCAAYLAAAGLKVRVLERRQLVGGAAVTEEFHPGFRNSTASYTVSLLRPQVIADMKLQDHGYRVVERQISNFLPFADSYLKLGGGMERTVAEFARFSKADAAAYPAYDAALSRVAGVLRDLTLQSPPRAGPIERAPVRPRGSARSRQRRVGRSHRFHVDRPSDPGTRTQEPQAHLARSRSSRGERVDRQICR